MSTSTATAAGLPPDYITTCLKADALREVFAALLARQSAPAASDAAQRDSTKLKAAVAAATDDLNTENEVLRAAVATGNTKLRGIEKQLQSLQGANEVRSMQLPSLRACLMVL